ncbi:MAG: ABC transporter ATP-binding protein [Anaerolineae bacterium]|nr:ABC transporter ATP-binding protein [Anaerolineae bacterium]
MSALIDFDQVSLRFRIYHNRTPSIKETVLDWLSQRQKRATGYTEIYALNQISLTIKSGDRLGIIGRNGAGKSTLLKAIAGIYPLHAGQLLVRGRVSPLIEMGAGFNPELSGRRNIYLNGAMLGIAPEAMAEHEAEIVEFAELAEFIDMPLKYYSSGMYSRLAFSIATTIQPEILLLDELLSTGDSHFVSKATARMRQLFSSSHIVILVSHTMPQILDLCNTAIVLHKGKLLMQGTPAECNAFYTSEAFVN